MIRVDFAEVRVSAAAGAPVMLLREVDGDRYLPIWINAAAGSAVLSARELVSTDYPSSHELLIEVLSILDGILERVEITDEEEGVFQAQLLVNGVVVPCRVSDGVALALRSHVGLWVSDDVIERCGVVAVPDSTQGTLLGESDVEMEMFREFLDSVSADDFTDGPEHESQDGV